MTMINVNNLTMEYKAGKGVFDIDFQMQKGDVYGFLGPNGAGKTTTIRCLLGFMKPSKGDCAISDKDCFTAATRLSLDIGYIPGETSFPSGMTGKDFLNFVASVRAEEAKRRGVKDERLTKAAQTVRMNAFIRLFELDIRPKIKTMSKGMKQKTAIIAAFMHDPDVFILDEPTSGLDPLMQSRFVDLLMARKREGKTILISSHMFEEIEQTVDRIMIIRDGRIVENSDIKSLRAAQKKVYYASGVGLGKKKFTADTKALSDDEIEATIPADSVDAFVKELAKHKVDVLYQKNVSLERIFLDYYGEVQQ